MKYFPLPTSHNLKTFFGGVVSTFENSLCLIFQVYNTLLLTMYSRSSNLFPGIRTKCVTGQTLALYVANLVSALTLHKVPKYHQGSFLSIELGITPEPGWMCPTSTPPKDQKSTKKIENSFSLPNISFLFPLWYHHHFTLGSLSSPT